MARYYFDLRDNDEFHQDDEGIELPDAESIRTELATGLLGLAQDHASLRPKSDMSIEVRDEAGRPLIRATLSFEVQILRDPSLH